LITPKKFQRLLIIATVGIDFGGSQEGVGGGIVGEGDLIIRKGF
jgi:hypothetical protein